MRNTEPSIRPHPHMPCHRQVSPDAPLVRRHAGVYCLPRGAIFVNTGRGSLVWERIPGGITSRTGDVDPRDLEIGRAMLQVTYQDYLDR